jgi:hypothetical protein
MVGSGRAISAALETPSPSRRNPLRPLRATYLAFVQLASIGCGSAQMSLPRSVGGEADAASVCLHEGFLTSS